ncbi:endospore germination permease [Lederbergia wuyishanensis]|uniref:Spore germination protein KB n=1 Tax=Lederbergia wuyishanensis TaxID=1347903 RepID=A0ABU0D5P1_9BACI|nr:endospore germination permease [Lederbergia wuyishanensis]MCJ8008315.1 spore germination protein [Lederbergia wuyishanensis]MDQ0343727.1 spore germination protein KB [Lederbergia wuyishanensis]
MEKERISSLQMTMLIYPTVVATAILSVPSITAYYAPHDLWMSPIFSSIVGFITVFIAYKLYKLYPKETIIQSVEKIIGKVPGKIIGFFILFFYIMTTGEIIRDYSEFIVGSFLFKTPTVVITGTMVLLCAATVHAGLEVLGRLAQLFFPLFVIPLFIFFLLLIPNYDIKNIFPILEHGILPPLKGSIILGGWFSELFLITFFLPFLKDEKKVLKHGFTNVLAIMVTLVLVNLTVLFVLGVATASKVYPLMNVGRYISYADFFENLESVIMAVWIVGAFIKISVAYYAVVIGTAQWLNLSDYKLIIWPIAILIVEFSFWSLPSSMRNFMIAITVYAPYSIFMQTVLPFFLLLIALFRKRKKKKTKITTNTSKSS